MAIGAAVRDPAVTTDGTATGMDLLIYLIILVASGLLIGALARLALPARYPAAE